MPKMPPRLPEPECAFMEELDATLSTSALGMQALMDLMAATPADHRVGTRALHALMLGVADQLGQAAELTRLVHLARGAVPGRG